jgi:hypothetical protein
MRKMYSFKLLPDLIEELKQEAKNENRSMNNYVEHLLITANRKKGIIIKNPKK